MMVLAQIFPTDAASLATIFSLKADIIAWAGVMIGVALSIYAYRKISSLISPEEHWDPDDPEQQGEWEDNH